MSIVSHIQKYKQGETDKLKEGDKIESKAIQNKSNIFIIYGIRTLINCRSKKKR